VINESGLCLCGCGQKTKPSRRGNKRLGIVKGEPLRYLPGHYAKHSYPKNWEDYPPPVRDLVSGCIRWPGPHDKAGYGRLRRQGKTPKAHREAWLRSGGEIPEGMTIDHVAARGCIYRDCVEVAHLEVVTRAENTRRIPLAIERKNRTHCPKGHPYSGENLAVIHLQGKSERRCRECGRAATRAWERKQWGRKHSCKGDWFCLNVAI